MIRSSIGLPTVLGSYPGHLNDHSQLVARCPLKVEHAYFEIDHGRPPTELCENGIIRGVDDDSVLEDIFRPNTGPSVSIKRDRWNSLVRGIEMRWTRYSFNPSLVQQHVKSWHMCVHRSRVKRRVDNTSVILEEREVRMKEDAFEHAPDQTRRG